MRQRRAVDRAERIVDGEYRSWRGVKEAEKKRERSEVAVREREETRDGRERGRKRVAL